MIDLRLWSCEALGSLQIDIASPHKIILCPLQPTACLIFSEAAFKTCIVEGDVYQCSLVKNAISYLQKIAKYSDTAGSLCGSVAVEESLALCKSSFMNSSFFGSSLAEPFRSMHLRKVFVWKNGRLGCVCRSTSKNADFKMFDD